MADIFKKSYVFAKACTNTLKQYFKSRLIGAWLLPVLYNLIGLMYVFPITRRVNSLILYCKFNSYQSRHTLITGAAWLWFTTDWSKSILSYVTLWTVKKSWMVLTGWRFIQSNSFIHCRVILGPLGLVVFDWVMRSALSNSVTVSNEPLSVFANPWEKNLTLLRFKTTPLKDAFLCCWRHETNTLGVKEKTKAILI